MAKGSLRLGSITKAEAGFDITRWFVLRLCSPALFLHLQRVDVCFT
jgi:hypothetical protein